MIQRILIVDDDATMLKALRLVLCAKGYEVETSQAPLEALAKLRAAPPDILLTDQVMVDMTGLELARRALAEHPELRCFVMSGHSAPSFLECAHVIWINKPIDVAELFASLEASARG